METAISWLSGGNVEQYMSAHQNAPNANELWAHFQAVVAWVHLTFTNYRSEMKGVDWGALHNQFKGGLYDKAKLEDEISPDPPNPRLDSRSETAGQVPN